jgi:hypothetical protein
MEARRFGGAQSRLLLLRHSVQPLAARRHGSGSFLHLADADFRSRKIRTPYEFDPLPHPAEKGTDRVQRFGAFRTIWDTGLGQQRCPITSRTYTELNAPYKRLKAEIFCFYCRSRVFLRN